MFESDITVGIEKEIFEIISDSITDKKKLAHKFSKSEKSKVE